MANFLSAIVGLTLAVILVTSVLIPTVKTANTADFTTSEVAMYALITLGVVIGLAYSAFNLFGVFS